MEIGSNFGRTLSDVTQVGSQRVQGQSLGQEDFLRLMVEQLRHQNPLEPQDQGEFFSQIAQFDTLETMHQIAQAIASLAAFTELTNASALLGRTVTAEVALGTDPDSGLALEPEVIVGTVERISFDRSGPLVHVDGRAFPIGLITEVA